ncbi:MAG: DNA-binding response regulator [Betaproteobacteria bacterium]|jgi:two-component system OmpR family response regulator|nr:DNA-binding response regulator [Betaproteobacteria bacterium]NBP35900.1 DNA-binding response regulator [Betaproteobacteria bacterium]NBP39321.1 DNA-binding response regulator [Betaproteobacteria bacterium]NBQ78911.1 DNA-binding response regulator [Betaproteobacteria bacterium]NBS40040.1 DNA-binding response regulator [Betaproteobacteria bacterium]
MRILLVEDDAVLFDIIQRSLSDAGMRVDCAQDLAIARHFWAAQSYDAVVLDLNLPLSHDAGRGSGLDLLKNMRRQGDSTPVLILTARNRTDERIAGLDAGADDYLGKPFELAELAARLRALIRRRQGSIDRVTVGRLCFDRSQRRVYVNDVELFLPARELDVLCELFSPPGRAVSKKDLSDKLSDFADMLTDNALEAFISRLRKKLTGSGASIRTLRGIGYRVEEESP